jgi:hypothetical protein
MYARIALAAGCAVAVLPLTATTSDAATTYFSSCASLHGTFRYGVAKSVAAANYQVAHGHHRPATTAYAVQVYNRNYTRLDRDRDGTACEN